MRPLYEADIQCDCIINDNQSRFRKKPRTADNLFILKTAIST